MKRMIEADWGGPYAWPKTGSDLPPLPAVAGVYLWTVEYQDGYLVYGAGITRRSVHKRHLEHSRNYRDGVYTALDIDAMRSGVRNEVWHGFWMKARSAERVADFEAKRETIHHAVKKQLEGFRIFVAALETSPRVLERTEAALMRHLYEQPPPFCDIPDRGMMLAPRRATEEAITLTNRCEHLLHTLPHELQI